MRFGINSIIAVILGSALACGNVFAQSHAAYEPTDEETNVHTPEKLHGTMLDLYRQELKKIKGDRHIDPAEEERIAALCIEKRAKFVPPKPKGIELEIPWDDIKSVAEGTETAKKIEKKIAELKEQTEAEIIRRCGFNPDDPDLRDKINGYKSDLQQMKDIGEKLYGIYESAENEGKDIADLPEEARKGMVGLAYIEAALREGASLDVPLISDALEFYADATQLRNQAARIGMKYKVRQGEHNIINQKNSNYAPLFEKVGATSVTMTDFGSQTGLKLVYCDEKNGYYLANDNYEALNNAPLSEEKAAKMQQIFYAFEKCRKDAEKSLSADELLYLLASFENGHAATLVDRNADGKSISFKDMLDLGCAASAAMQMRVEQRMRDDEIVLEKEVARKPKIAEKDKPGSGDRDATVRKPTGGTATKPQRIKDPEYADRKPLPEEPARVHTEQEQKIIDSARRQIELRHESMRRNLDSIDAIVERAQKTIEELNKGVETDTKALAEQEKKAEEFIAYCQKQVAASKTEDARKDWQNRLETAQKMLADGTWVDGYWYLPRNAPEYDQIGKKRWRIRNTPAQVRKIQEAVKSGECSGFSAWKVYNSSGDSINSYRSYYNSTLKSIDYWNNLLEKYGEPPVTEHPPIRELKKLEPGAAAPGEDQPTE